MEGILVCLTVKAFCEMNDPIAAIRLIPLHGEVGIGLYVEAERREGHVSRGFA